MSALEQLYVDGGCVESNPSPYGITWAWCLINGEGKLVARDSGLLTIRQIGLPTGTNNVAELYAVWRALNDRSANWVGTIHTDSLITLRRITGKNPKFNGVPNWLIDNVERVKRKQNWDIQFVKAHPTKSQLTNGQHENGSPVSRWNSGVTKNANG